MKNPFGIGIKIMLFLAAACNADNVDEVNYESLPRYEIQFYDTTFLENQSSGLVIVQKQADKILSFEEDNGKIHILSEQGKIISSIMAKGDGPEQYNDIRKIGFLSDNSVAVLDKKKLLIFTLDGKLISSCDFKDLSSSWPSFSNERLYQIGKEKLCFESLNNKYTSEIPKLYFDNAHFGSIINIQNCSIQNFGRFDLQSVYNKKGLFFNPLLEPLIDFNVATDNILISLPLEKKIFIYSPNGGYVRSFLTLPAYFNEQPEGAKGYDPDAQLIVLQKNSYYKAICSNKENIYLFYVKHRKDEEKIYSSISEDEKAWENIFFNRTFYLEVYDLNGRKRSQDILISEKLINVVDAESPDKLIFQVSLPDKEGIEKIAIVYGRIILRD